MFDTTPYPINTTANSHSESNSHLTTPHSLNNLGSCYDSLSTPAASQEVNVNPSESSDDELTRKHINSGIFLQRNKRKLKQIRKAMLNEKDGEELQ